MMHLEQSNFLPCNRLKLSIIIALIVAQPILFSYLLALDVSATLLLTLLCGIPIALGSSFLLTRGVNHCYARMSIVMFAAGGFGMLLGYVVDLNQMGLYALLSICRATPSSMSGWGLGALWQKIQLTPWTYLGMFGAGNLGMLFLDDIRPGHSLAFRNVIYIYVICNVSMLYGMLLGEGIFAALIDNLNQFLAAGLMVISMLLGMIFGMVVLMALVNRLSKHTLLPT